MQKLLYIIVVLLTISGCQPTINYDYWVTHLSELEKQYSKCQQNDEPSCSEVKRAAHDMGELIYEQTSSPESFGKKIIVVQDSLVKTKKTDVIYEQKLQQLKMMYAVVALHGPE